jgi:D-ribose pyranase
MLKTGILNPHILSLLSRVRHTNLLVIADRGLPSFPSVETIDLTLVDNIPTVLQVIAAVRQNFDSNQAFMAREFFKNNSVSTRAQFERVLAGIPITRLPHVDFKKRIPGAIGLIRTADTTQWGNVILVSG